MQSARDVETSPNENQIGLYIASDRYMIGLLKATAILYRIVSNSSYSKSFALHFYGEFSFGTYILKKTYSFFDFSRFFLFFPFHSLRINLSHVNEK